MYSLEKVQQVLDLRKEGLTTREIAKRLKIAKGTVLSMLKGDVKAKLQRPVTHSRKRRRNQFLLQENYPLPINPNHPEKGAIREGGTVEYERCEGCGGMSMKGVPCHTCRVKKVVALDFDCYMNELLTPSPVNMFPIKGPSL